MDPTKLQTIASSHNLRALCNMATTLRIHSVSSTTAANSGHPTSCASIAELMAVLFFDSSGLKYFPDRPRDLRNDKMVLSKGHCAPILYAAWAEAGLFPTSNLQSLRMFGHELEGHPTPKLSFIDIATGSLGQGISAACGMAYSMKFYEKNPARVYCLLGDGECAEGSVWEAFNFAAYYSLDNLVGIIDVNRLGQSGFTMFQHDLETYKIRLEAFGWNTICIDGHDVAAVIYALDFAREQLGKPTAIIAKSYKGKDLGENIQDQQNCHGKPVGDPESVLKHLNSLLTEPIEKLSPTHPEPRDPPRDEAATATLPPPNYTRNSAIATRQGYGDALSALAALDPRVLALDGDTKTSTKSDILQQSRPSQFIECFIAEQNMIGVALGLSCRGQIPFASTFAAFMTRGFDHIRMCGLSYGNVKFVGSHCGISIGEDGGSQMSLEDIAEFRCVAGSVVLYPSDAVGAYRAVELAYNYRGPVYIRNNRPNSAVIYENSQEFSIGKSLVVRDSAEDQVTVIGAGMTLHEALTAYETLKKEGIPIRVIDLFSVKPLDTETILNSAKATQGKIIVVEDHYRAGGLFEAISSELASSGLKIYGLHVEGFPCSGKHQELYAAFKIDSGSIISKVREVL